MDLVVGRLTTNPGGFGFVVPDQPDPDAERPDIYIPAANLSEAMHGDRVVVRVERRTERGAEGRIIRILERSQSSIVGRYEVDDAGLGYVVPFDKRVLTDVQVPTGQSSSAEPGEMVLVEITRWPSATRGPVGKVVEVLGRIDEPGVDTQIIIRKFGIPDRHSEESIAEATRLGTVVKERDIKGRTDFRNVTTVTIDGEHARDFDDAITIERLPNGHFWLGVHIADVSHYVTEGSALDEEAYERGTSVYFTERAVHMFPSELATGLCSLNPNVDRLVQSCLMEVDRQGAVVRYEMHDGVINSDARMTYTAVNAILTDRDPETMFEYQPLVPMFEHDARAVRHPESPATAARLDRLRPAGGRGHPVRDWRDRGDRRERTQHRASHHRGVHAARQRNSGSASREPRVSRHCIACTRRLMRRRSRSSRRSSPRLATASPRAAARSRPKHFQKLIDRMKGTPEERPIAALMLRTMQKARYDAASLGHFGLAVEHYTHFTSPIRRYPDLVVHRMLRESRQGPIADARREELEEELPETARHASDMERRADEAERELLQWKKVRFMANKVGDEYGGYITGVAPFGLFVELIEHYVEGLVHVSSMADDYYRFVEQEHVLRGEHTKKMYRLGDRVDVQVVRVDMERRQVDLGIVEILEHVRRDERGTRQVRSRVKPKKRAPTIATDPAGASARPGSHDVAARTSRRLRCRPLSRP